MELSRNRVAIGLAYGRTASPSDFASFDAGDYDRDANVQPVHGLGDEAFALVRSLTTSASWQSIASTAFGVTGAEAAHVVDPWLARVFGV